MKRKQHLLLSILSGLLLSLAWPENGFTLLIFVALVPLFIIQEKLNSNGKRGMFGYAFLSFLIWNVLTTFWIWNATKSGSVAAFVLNSLFMSLVFLAFHLSKKWLYNNRSGLWIFVFYWITWEAFHMNWDLSWPWLTLGNVFATHNQWIQWYDITGTLGGSLWVLAGNVVAFHFISFLYEKNKRKTIFWGLLFIFIIVVPISISKYQYHHYQTIHDPVQVVAVQPNIDPYTEEYVLPADTIIARNLNLAGKLIDNTTDYVLLPESTIQENIWEESIWRSPSLKKLNAFVKQYPHLSMIVGASTFRWIGQNEKKTNAARIYKKDLYYYAFNTALYIDHSSYIQIHHKSKLVPGVEMMPSWKILKPLEKLAIDLGGVVGSLQPDEHITLFSNNRTNAQISPLICYESAYGDYVTETIREGAEIIFIITNDGWWGDTPGYRQHFLMAIPRAIENRRDVAQSSTTGISGFVDQKGDILQQTNYQISTAVKETLDLNSTLTFYVQHGDWIARMATFISALVLLAAVVQGFLKRNKQS